MSLNVTVLDMQPIDPPVGGGRIRLLGLYHDLGVPTTYIGSYDWPGPGFRNHKLTESLTEINIPLSDEHFRVHEKWKSWAGGHNLIDTTFPLMAPLSRDYVAYIGKVVVESDVVIFSHPWAYPLLREQLNEKRQVIIYDSQNFEGLLRTELLGSSSVGLEISKEVVLSEFELSHRADVIVACSEEDCTYYNSIYQVDASKLMVIPNGVFSTKIIPPTVGQKRAAKRKINCQGRVVIFLGSAYEPNIKAVQFLISEVATSCPDIIFLICGGVSNAVELDGVKGRLPSNVRIIGHIPEEDKIDYLWAADIAVNPMFSGSGTNIKMFDFMAAGLPVISTPIGARGIDLEFNNQPTVKIAHDLEFSDAIKKVFGDEFLLGSLSASGRELVLKKFSWEKISPDYGQKIIELHRSIEWSKRQIPHVTLETISAAEQFPAKTDKVLSSEYDFAIMTPWDIRCGIAEYSKYFIQALEKFNRQCCIFSCEDNKCNTPIPLNVKKVEGNWAFHELDHKRITKSCNDNKVSTLIVQHHQGFFGEESLVDLTRACIQSEIEVYLTLHNTIDMSSECLLKLCDLNPRIIVHNRREQERLLGIGLEKVFYLPMGIIDIQYQSRRVARKKFNINGDPVIGCFGFLRPHKGVAELVEAISILKDLYPNILLLGMNALYPSEDSSEYLDKIERNIIEKGLIENVILQTDFLEIDEVIRYLQSCDIVVLPYDYSSEGASASIATVASSKRPIIATKQDVFNDYEKIIYSVESNSPPVLAACISTALSNPYLLRQLQTKVIDYVRLNSWEEVAKKFLHEILI